jgi:aromatic-L-amino-acid decarboxylase
MNTRDFRTFGHQFVDWMADYLDAVERLPVKTRVKPGEIASQLPAEPPRMPEPMDRIFRDFETIVLPGMTHWQHPSFFGYFPANSSRPSVLAEMLTATLAAQCMNWETSPAATELESRMLEWLRQVIGLPPEFVGSIHDTASTATLCAILTARERVTDFAVNESGMSAAGVFTTYCSAEAHSSIEKGIKIAGLGRMNLRKIEVDESLAMVPGALDRSIAADVEAGHTPVCVVACIGTTGTSGIDPLQPIADVCRRHGVWLHVDAAWAGSALILPEYRWMIDGIDGVDSFVFNPHKWLFTNFDCSAYFVRDVDALLRTFHIAPEYLKTWADDAAINYRDWGIPLGRRFRALKLWFVVRSYGVEGLQQMLRFHISLAQQLAGEIEAATDFELLVAPKLALMCFRYRPPGLDDQKELDALNERLCMTLNDSGELFLTHTRINGNYAIRFQVGQTGTQERHVKQAWQRIIETARGMERGAGITPAD